MRVPPLPLLFLCALAIGLAAAASVAPTARADSTLVCLDPGHGGSDPGAVNGALDEADINLDVAFALADRLAADGIDSVFTRTNDSTKSSRDRYEFCNAQNATILISVHTNSVADPSIDGTLAIYFHRDDQVLAQALHDAMWAKLQPTAPDPESFIDFGLKKDALGVLLKSDMPAATAEPVFMSHPDEAARLAATVAQCPDSSNNLCRRAQIVDALYQGTIAYLTAAPPPPPDDDGGPGNGNGPPPGRGR